MVLFHPLYSTAEVVDKVVAVVNDDIITQSELEAEAAGLYQKITMESDAQSLVGAMDQAREMTLDSMIDQRLIQQRSKLVRVNVSDKEVDEAYNRMRAKVSLGEEEFRDKLRASGMTEENYRNKLRATILQSKVLSVDVRSKIVVTNEMILSYYDANYTSKVDDDDYYLLQMGFTWDDSLTEPAEIAAAKDNALNTAQRIRGLLGKGQDFRTLARKFSDLPSATDGGDIGVFELDEMASAMRSAVTDLQPGEISSIIELGSAFQFFKLLSGDKESIVVAESFDAVKEEIREILYEDKLKDAYEDWVKDLKNKAYIQKL